MRIYVVSSWRASWWPKVIKALQEMDHEVHTGGGFSWGVQCPFLQVSEYQAKLDDPKVVEAFHIRWDLMHKADLCVLVPPCGAGANLVAGYFVGAAKHLLVFLGPGDIWEPELMYRMASGICGDLDTLKKQVAFFDS